MSGDILEGGMREARIWRQEWHLRTSSNPHFPSGASGKEPTCQCRKHKRCGSISGPGRSPGEENDNTLQCS